jgi:hypothetical protein
LLERVVNLKIEETYPKVKAALTAKDSKVISEEAPNQICFKQGSLWGISPKTAKKTIIIHFEQDDERTRIKFSSKLSSDWKNITIVGCAFAAILVCLCIWMATDLSAFTATNIPGFWGWLVMVNGSVDLAAAQAFVRLTWVLAGFLSFIIVLEAAIVVYAQSKIDSFTQEALKEI